MDLPTLFSESGPLARAFDGYCVRTEQIEMSQAIQTAIREASTVVLEAGTGVGKTAAYLVPALLEGGKVIVSTGTKALQDQLFHRDLPAVREALAVPILVGLGMDELSMASPSIPRTKQLVRGLEKETAGRLAGDVLGLGTAGEVREAVAAWLRARS